jgi:hypothetical protein
MPAFPGPDDRGLGPNPRAKRAASHTIPSEGDKQ